MELFERFEELNEIIAQMNQQAVDEAGVPYLRLHEFVHYMDVKVFLHAYARRLRLSAAQRDDLLQFCYEDTLDWKSRIGMMDLYAFTYRYFKHMTFRTGNLDTPDDCVEKLDLDRFTPYRKAREKQWRREKLTPEEVQLVENFLAMILADMK